MSHCRSCAHYQWANLVCMRKNRDTRPEFPACDEYKRHPKWTLDSAEVSRMPLAELMRLHIDEGMSITEMAEYLGASVDRVERRFRQERARGAIRRIKRGRYAWSEVASA